MMNMDKYIRVRSDLHNTVAAIRRGKLTIGFVGGSITEPVRGMRWSDKIADWFCLNFPGLELHVENSGKGATGCLSAIMRVEEDIVAYGCDLVFVETAVNDAENTWGPCREGVIRHLLRSGKTDVVLGYTFCQGWYEGLLQGREHPSVLDWEELAEHYRLSSVFMGGFALDLNKGGFLRWEEWLPDGLHPEHAGSRIYSLAMAHLLRKEIENPRNDPFVMPAPLHEDNWESLQVIPLEEIRKHGAWRIIREYRVPAVKRVLYTPSVTSTLSFEFDGRGVIIDLLMSGFNMGYRIRFDGGEWTEMVAPAPDWAFDAIDWVRQDLHMCENTGHHVAEIEPRFLPNGRGTAFSLCHVGVVK